MGTRWGGLVVVVALMLASVRLAGAQDQDLETIKKRLEALEKEKADRDAEKAVKEEHGADAAETKWYDKVHVGGGIRAAYRSQEDQAANGRNYSHNFDLDSGRLYTGGKITDVVSATLNAEFTSAGASVLDAIAEFKFQDEFNIFVGRMLPACDRSDSDGPYYLIAWDYPELSVNFTNSFNGFGRSDGVTFWGDIHNFKYWAGAYEGTDPGGPMTDHLLYAARVQYDFLDDEKGYYLSSTYHGGKSILAVAFAVNYQSGVAGVVGDQKNQTNLDLDVLFEKKFDFGTPTVELAVYDYLRGGYGGNGVGGLNGAGSPALGQGKGFMATLAFLIPQKIGWGEFQPFVRYQGFDEKKTDAKNPTKDNFDRWDLGVNYVISGHNARISMIYSVMDHKESVPANTDRADHLFTIGTQVQF
jgi:hypothetical protein